MYSLTTLILNDLYILFGYVICSFLERAPKLSKVLDPGSLDPGITKAMTQDGKARIINTVICTGWGCGLGGGP